jgi:5-methyltetrahydrofolate--homocysteine methyltransferase
VLNELYHQYYDAFYEISKDDVPGNCFTCFAIWGKGKTIKLQCDFAALMNPEQFSEFFVPYLRDQARHYDRRLYHFDGPCALQHLDAVLAIPEIDAVQWVPGAGNTPSGDEKWFWIYDKVKDSGKSLWINLYGSKDHRETVAVADRIVSRYGNDGLYLLFPGMSKPEADALMHHAEHDWK